MTTPERDPLGAMFDQYAERTAAETTRATGGQLRRRMHRHRTARVAAVGVAAAVLAVPAGWALQNAGAADEPVGAADQGAITEDAPCAVGGTYAILAEGTTYEDYIAIETVSAGIVLSPDETIEEFAARADLYLIAQGIESHGFVIELEPDQEQWEVLGLPDEDAIVVTFYGTFEEGAPVQVLSPCDEESPTEEPSEGNGTPSYEPSEGGEEPSEGGEEPSETDEAPSEGGDEPSEGGEEPSSDGSTPTAEEPTTGFDEPSEYSTP